MKNWEFIKLLPAATIAHKLVDLKFDCINCPAKNNCSKHHRGIHKCWEILNNWLKEEIE